MPSFYTSPYMGMPIPVPTVQIGPDWANNVNASLTVTDAHNHSPGSGQQITPSGLNINSDLNFNNYNGIGFRSTRFQAQGSALVASTDLACLYSVGVDLYFNDGNGNAIRITQSGAVSGASGTITGLPTGTASAAYSAASGTFIFQQATATAANIDAGSIIVRYPGSYPTPAGNCIVLRAPSSIASQWSVTLPALPSQTGPLIMSTAGVLSGTSYDQVGISMTATGANAIGQTMGALGANHVVFVCDDNNSANNIASLITSIPSANASTIVNQCSVASANALVFKVNDGNSANNIGQLMTAAGANNIVSQFTGMPAVQANIVAANMTSSGAGQIGLTMSVAGANNVVFKVNDGNSANNIGLLMTSTGADSIANQMSASGANLVGGKMTSTGANAVANARTRSVASSVGIGGIAISASSGSVSWASPLSLTVCTAVIQTAGRPVMVGIYPDVQTIDYSYIESVSANGFINIKRNGTILGQMVIEPGEKTMPAFQFIDNVGSGGTYTYTFNVYSAALFGAPIIVSYITLNAYEL